LPEKIKFTCPVCDQDFCNTDFHEGFAADSCECGNLTITIRDFNNPVSQKNYLAIGFKEKKPIFDFEERKKK
jgi:hypothetical protein